MTGDKRGPEASQPPAVPVEWLFAWTGGVCPFSLADEDELLGVDLGALWEVEATRGPQRG